MSDGFVKIQGKSLIGTDGSCTVNGSELKSFDDIEQCKRYVLSNYRLDYPIPEYNYIVNVDNNTCYRGGDSTRQPVPGISVAEDPDGNLICTKDPIKRPVAGFSVSKDGSGNLKCYVDDGKQKCPLFKDNNSHYYLPTKYPASGYDRIVIRRSFIVPYKIPDFDRTKTWIKDMVIQNRVEGKIGDMNVMDENLDVPVFFVAPRCDPDGKNCRDTSLDDEKPAVLFSLAINPYLWESRGALACLPTEMVQGIKGCKTFEHDERVKNASIDIISRGTISKAKWGEMKEYMMLNMDIEHDDTLDTYIPYPNNKNLGTLEELFRELQVHHDEGFNIKTARGKSVIMPNPKNRFILEGNSVFCFMLGFYIGNTRVIYFSNGVNYLYTGTDYTVVEGGDPQGFVIEYDNPINRVESYDGSSSAFNFDKSSLVTDINAAFYGSSRKEDTDNSTSSSSSDSKKWIIIASIVAGILILGIIAYIIYRKRKNQK